MGCCRNKILAPELLIRSSMTKFFLTTLLLLSTLCKADFNPRTGSYHGKWQDLDFLTRIYDSRNLFSGYFGFGWCSNLEIQIERKWNSDLILHSCQTAQEILLKSSSKKLWLGPNGLKAKLNGQSILIDLGEFGLLGFPIKGGFPKSIGKFQIKRTNSNILTISKNGRLKFKITFDESRRKITAIVKEAKNIISYNFIFDDLISVSESTDSKSKVLTTYSYDSAHNLLATKNLGQLTELMSYDEENDRLISYRNSAGISLSMTYKSKDKNAFETQITDNNRPQRTQIFSYPNIPTFNQRLGGNSE
jgi:hypothetical protein